jgi:Spy/CpxP family protein refolding chaperone
MQPSRDRLTALGLALAALLASSVAYADATQSQSFTMWHQMDECAKQSNKQFPDHTPEGNAKREAARVECLRAHHLPVTAANPPPAPPR